MISNEPFSATNPDCVWLPLDAQQMVDLAAGVVVRLEVPADPDQGTAAIVVMIRPPKP